MPDSARHRPILLPRLGVAAAAALALGGSLLVATPAQAAAGIVDGTADHPEFLGKTHYTGEFHSHTAISDGVKMPQEAYAFVEQNSDVDFFATTDHDVTMDVRAADDWIDDHAEAESEEWRHLKDGVLAHNVSGSSDLVVDTGEEVTWYDGSGHMNVFGAEWLLTAPGYVRGSSDALGGTFPLGDYMYDLPTFYARLAQDPDAFAQFNHPSPTGKGNFWDFDHLTPEADAAVPLFEHKGGAAYDAQWRLALDRGWHVAPTYSGDEHSDNWVVSDPALTGVWAEEHTVEGLHEAMRERSVYMTPDENAVLGFSGNGQMMGSILPGDTDALDIDVQLADPDDDDSFAKVQVITNGGEVAHTFADAEGNPLELSTELDVSDGDYYFVEATQADGAKLISAPIWIGERVRGANYAPRIELASGTPETAEEGATIALPEASATDDGGGDPEVSFEVYSGERQLPVEDGAFTIEGYDDHFIVVKAADETGSTAAEIIRIEVDTADLDPEAVFRHYGTVASVGESAGEAGLSVPTDLAIDDAWVQIQPAGALFGAEAQEATSSSVFEVNSTAVETEEYIDGLTSHAMRSHEFDLAGLDPGERYTYRFGTGEGGPWTDVRGEFVAGGEEDAPVYVLGDVQVGTGEQSDFELPAEMLAQLREERPDGETVIQVGDLVDNGANGSQWQGTFDHSLDGLDLQFATMAGNHETYSDFEVNDVLSTERNRILGGFFDHPGNGAGVGESNYSFDRGSIHFSVLNSNYDLDQQLDWLEDDVRSSGAEWNVVVEHFPYYGGRHSSDAGMAMARAKVTETLDQLGVDLHIGGHDHVYKRSTIRDGELVTDDAERDLGTTFVTMGSSGPKFYDNDPQWWDDVVYDDDTQTGLVLEAADGELQARAYTIDGELVDEFAVSKPQAQLRVTSHDVVDGELSEIGLLSTDGAPDDATLVAASYDLDGKRMRDVRTVDVELDHRGVEQIARFDSPLPVASDSTVRLFVWDGLGTGRALLPQTLVREGMPGEGTEAEPYELRTWADVEKISQDPDAHYALMNDLDLDGESRTQIGSGTTPFSGVFDGRGHTVRGFAADEHTGSGLFQTNEGVIRDLAVTGADISSEIGTAGILADVNDGTIERSWTAGSLAAPSRAGGLVGDSTGIIRDSYSTADVTVSGTEAGGAVGVALGGSTTENVYASGTVRSDTRNVGGVVGYGYNGTVIRDTMSLNPAVVAPSWAHAVLGRVLSGNEATLSGLYARDDAFVSAESLDAEPASDNLKGERLAADVWQSSAHYSDALGWDLDEVWQWDDEAQRPLLASNPEDAEEAESPDLPTNEDGFFEISGADELTVIDEFPTERFVLAEDIDLTGTDVSPLASTIPFTGELDGAGHAIRGLESEAGGLFALNGGTIHDLAIEDARVSSASASAGILANISTGTVERVTTSGEISGPSRVGGILGDSGGQLRDAYSTAQVHAEPVEEGAEATEVGGAVGVALARSVSERVYAAGDVSAETRNVGGVFGYGYTGTVIRDSVSLAPSVTAPSWAHRFLGRVLSGNTATLENNWGSEGTTVDKPTDTSPPAATNLHGATATEAQTGAFGFYRDALGFDDGTWQWSASDARPVLIGVGEGREVGGQEPGEPPVEHGPDLEADDDGAFLVSSPEDLAEVGAWPGESYRLAGDLDLTGVDARITAPLSGSFDGAGHAITGYSSADGGLFASVSGSIGALALEDASVDTAAKDVGLLVDRVEASGTVSEVRTTGEIRGASTVGGVVGSLSGTVRDTASGATVTADGGRQAGGVAGIAGRGSTTERVLATGSVEVEGDHNAGGVVGYAYATTTVTASVALNDSITAVGHSGRVAARELAGERATFADNLASETIAITGQTVADEGRDTLNGETITAEQAASEETFADIGWDFDAVWAWDEGAGAPVPVKAR
ncbi:MAG: CehA/McbA family metallohydrolase [Microbacterium sp.]